MMEFGGVGDLFTSKVRQGIQLLNDTTRKNLFQVSTCRPLVISMFSYNWSGTPSPERRP